MLESFAGLGLEASGGAMAIGDFMRPGVIAATGLDAAEPLLDASADLLGPVGLFTNFFQIMILLVAWIIVVLAFFILAVQVRSEEHTSELQSLMRISYAVFCLKKTKQNIKIIKLYNYT